MNGAVTTPSGPPARRAPLAGLAVFAAMVLLVVLGHEGRRVAQLLVLALPVLAWPAWPVRSPAVHRLRGAVVWLWAMAFAFDAVARAYLLEAYQAAPDSALVLGAAANTNARESGEYLAMHWRSLAAWSAVLLAAALVFGRFAPRGARGPAAGSRWLAGLLCLAVLASALAYASKPWRRLHPAVFWSQWGGTVQTLRAGWADRQQQREAVLARARAAAPVIAETGPSTLVLVITDSINRDNMALYGYGRATTPRLLAHKAQLQDQMLVMRNAWSVDASTLPSVHNILNFGQPESQDPQHVLALARAAGYKTWWMSNHDDIGIEQQHARLADVVEIVNRVPGRAGASLDGELLDCLQEALEDPAERKLIVVHFLGAHPHYALRFPDGANPFDDSIDRVEEQLSERGRSAWVRRFRQEYDSAILYSDFVVAETLRLARGVGRQDGYRAWMFLSDHGQEVGHGGDHAGHSPQTASGYRIPAIVWRNRPIEPRDTAAIEARPLRTDWASWTLAELLHLRWPGDATERDALRPNYRWQPPVLPMAVESFER
ncbi:sulfatase-like hydrolase/transferase [Xylophilus rhododendri]|uniref:Sulfatase-like hydrolase/transferase n=1 Tax=Xylophilus rhododendri TaxID=2697032 RepID=A0A857JB49_9BURK|nr:phosphoethanolamine transferase [Xylophilus rhododendri]QHJ00434.1 sulfatase-like hydrolase/transferase [Xylophilus rhododendri]